MNKPTFQSWLYNQYQALKQIDYNETTVEQATIRYLGHELEYGDNTWETWEFAETPEDLIKHIKEERWCQRLIDCAEYVSPLYHKAVAIETRNGG